MKILVLGGTRFFGTHLVKSLIEEGHDIIVGTRGNQEFSFKNKIQFEKIDRDNYKDLERLAELGPFDIIYDQICMTAKNADDSCKAFKGKCKRYVFTSTGTVYNPVDERELTEGDFDQDHYLINLDADPKNYQESKRQAEAIFSKQAPFPVVMVRFPIVLGKDDYKERLKFHVECVRDGKEIYFPNLMVQLGFIQSNDAGAFLHFIGKHNFTGAINAASNGYISLFDMMAMIEKIAGKRVMFAEKSSEDNYSPFGFGNDFMMSNKLASSLGHKFESLQEYLPELIKKYLS